jgi:hypothetical protein
MCPWTQNPTFGMWTDDEAGKRTTEVAASLLNKLLSFNLHGIKCSELLGFRTLSIVRYSKNQNTQLFGNWISFRPQVREETSTLLGPLERPNLNHWKTYVKIKVKIIVMLRLTVSRPVCLGIEHPSGAYDQIFITVRQLRVCWCGALSLTRGRVCRLQLLLALARAVILGSECRGTREGRILEIENPVGIENTKNRSIWHTQPIRTANPLWTFLQSGFPFSAMRFRTHGENLYDVAHSSCFILGFRLEYSVLLHIRR